jgi:hypothetical protein
MWRTRKLEIHVDERGVSQMGLSAPMLGWIPSRIEYHAEQTSTVQLRSHVSDYGHPIWNYLGGDGMGSTVAGLSLELRL